MYSSLHQEALYYFFSDSKSALQALQSKDWTNPLILQLLEHHFLCTVLDKTIHFCWIPISLGLGRENSQHGARPPVSGLWFSQPGSRNRHKHTRVRSCLRSSAASTCHLQLPPMPLGLLYRTPVIMTLFCVFSSSICSGNVAAYKFPLSDLCDIEA